MSTEYDTGWLDSLNLTGSALTFAEFCSNELERRSNEEDFDAEIFDEAVKLVLRKLGALNLDGMQ